MLILGLLGMYFDTAVVFVTQSSLFFRLAVAILWSGLYQIHLFICSSDVLTGKVFVHNLNVANSIWQQNFEFFSFRFTGQSPRGHVERPLGSVLHYDV